MTRAGAEGASGNGILDGSRRIESAARLIRQGARLQVLEGEVGLSHERLLKLYREVAGRSPSKGQLPFSTHWYLSWQPQIHASAFHNIYIWLLKSSSVDELDALSKSHALYVEQMDACGLAPALSITRAWRLVRFVEAGMLSVVPCSCCGGRFIAEPYTNARHFVCGLCKPPSRAGKGSGAGALRLDAAA
ncbi:MAG: flagellar transcriptional regulator FlhC [Gammaproteobacteria bacterium]|nr:flagellar transcriptional regulator FlhC [Gammaproteobacteria bacterium]MBU1441337.1 flagellar transcriptional regulator FlhC [Gammaproteobacteria bacterium]MBU2410528.1 flagellar transcriptional regulator FlhC [Gammaproteobacteria bacterium]